MIVLFHCDKNFIFGMVLYDNERRNYMKDTISELQFYKTISENLISLYEESGLQYNEEIESYRDELVHLLDDSRYSVVVMGTFSRGKSTFLNAVIGKEFLYYADKEATSIINYILNSDTLRLSVESSSGVKQYPRFFTNAEEAEEEIRTKIKEANASSEDNVSRLIFEYPISGFDQDIVFIDTPGLCGFKKDALETTKKAINEANAVIMLLNYKGLDNSELQLLSGNSEFGNIRTDNLILVINRIGEMFDDITPEEENVKIQRSCEEIERNLKEHKLYEKYRNVKIFAVDSRDYLHSVDSAAFKKYKYEVPQSELRRRSRFDDFRNYLVGFLEKGNRTVELKKSMQCVINEFIQLLRDYYDDALKNEKSVVQERKNKLNHRIEKIDTDKKRMMRKLKSFAELELLDLNDDIQKDIEEKCKETEVKYQEQIPKLFKFPEDFERRKYDSLTRSIDCDVKECRKKINNEIIELYKSVVNLLEQRIGEETKELHKLVFNENKNSSVRINIEKIELPDIKVKAVEMSDSLDELEKKIKGLNTENEKLEKEKPRLEEKLKCLKKEHESREEKIEDDYNRQMSRLPAQRPSTKPIKETYTEKEKVFLFIKKTVERTRTVGYDDSEGQEYDKKKAEIINNYQKSLASLNIEYSQKISEVEKSKVKNENKVRDNKSDIKFFERELKRKKEERKEQIRRNQQEVLMRKQDMLDEITMNIISNAFDTLKNYLRHNNDDFKGKLAEKIESCTTDVVNKLRSELEKQVNQLDDFSLSGYAELSEKLEDINTRYLK